MFLARNKSSFKPVFSAWGQLLCKNAKKKAFCLCCRLFFLLPLLWLLVYFLSKINKWVIRIKVLG